MMKKAICCVLLALAFVLIGHERSVDWMETSLRSAMQRQEETKTPSFTEQMGGEAASDLLDVTLYYRSKGTQLLSAQQGQLDIRREETIATSIVRQLIAGPQSSSGTLEGLFPQGTTLISATAEGTTAFVTLSRAFLSKPDGAPTDWEDLAQWQEEAALRRMLAVQSLVLSLTEDGRYQRVQVYIADNDDAVPERIDMAYFGADSAGMVLGACSRDESFLLTPQRVLLGVLDCWQRRDYAALYAALVDGRETLPAQAAFEAKMRELDVSLLSYETTAGSVSFDGKRATLVLNAQIRTPDGGDATLNRESVALQRDAENWVMTYDTLLSLMVRD